MRNLAAPERIAILTPFRPTARAGGVEVFCRQIQLALGPARIFAPAEMSSPRSHFLARLGLLGPYRAALEARAFLKAHEEHPYDLVIANGLFGWPLRLGRPDIPMIQVYHFTMAGLAQAALPLPSERLTTARVAGWFDRQSGVGKNVVAVSESVRREVLRFYGLESTVVPNSVDVSLFHRVDRQDARDQLGLPKDRTIGLFVGRPEYAKGFDVLRDVAAALDDTLFLSVSRPADAPGNVRFFTGVPHETMPLLYSAADVFLSPSRYEGFNLSLVEALACELPAVVSRAACAFDDEPSDFAVLVERPTAEAFVEGIRLALKEGPRSGVRERVADHYSSEVFLRNWRALAASVQRGEAAQFRAT